MVDQTKLSCKYAPSEKLEFLTIETTTLCNLSCRGCQRTKLVSEHRWQNLHMGVETFKNIVSNLPEVGAVTLHGIGEPTLNPAITEITRLAKASGKFGQLLIYSNGQNKNTSIFKSLKAAGLDKVVLSIDSLSEETAHLCRNGTKIGLLHRTIDAIKSAELNFETSTVASSYNQHEIIDTLGKLDLMGPDVINIQTFLNLGDPAGCLSEYDKVVLLRAIEETAENCLNRPVRTFGFDLSKAPELCGSPWKEPAITVEGFLTPCCFTFDPSLLGFSSLSTQTYKALWQSKRVQEFLHAYTERCPSFCKGCYTNKREVTQHTLPKYARVFLNDDKS